MTCPGCPDSHGRIVMSSILKALRKLEEEKRGGKLEAPDLRVDQGQSTGKSTPLVPLAAGIVCGAAVVVLLFLVPGGSDRKPEIVQNEPRTAVATVAEQTQPLPQAAAVKPVSPETAAPSQASAPAPAKSEALAAVAASGKDPAVSEGRSATSAAARSQVQRVPQAVAEKPVIQTTTEAPPPASAAVSANSETPEAVIAPGNAPGVSEGNSVDDSAVESQAQIEQPADVVVAARPSGVGVVQTPFPKAAQLPAGIHLQVSEIYYQGDLNSMAVVNDLPVMVGSHIESALVTEIQADRVLFEIDGEVFPVSPPQP